MPLNPKHPSQWDICLSDPRGRKPDWYLKLLNGWGSAAIEFMSPDTNNIYINSVGKRIGDFDEQRDWKGGRGGESFSDDPSKFFDSLNCWTLSTGHVTPTLLWQYATGYRSVVEYMPGASKSVSFVALTGSTRFVASEALGALTAADKAKIWIRRVGNPGSATVELRAADTLLPNGAVRQSAAVTTATITDVISVLYTFDWTGTQNVTAGDFLVIYGAATDNSQNHWEVGVDAAVTGSRNSTTGTGAWSISTFRMYFRVTDADTARRWFFFNNGTFSVVDKKDSGASQVYTVDSSASLTEVATTGLGTVTARPVVGNGNRVYFPQGESVNIRSWDGAAAWADDGTNKATFLVKGHDLAKAGPVIWLVHTTAGTVSTAAKAAVASPLVPDAALTVGDNNTAINGAAFWENNGLYIFKTDSAYKIVYNTTTSKDEVTKLQWGMENTPSAANGTFALPFQQFLYFPWLFSLERLYGSQVDDVGQGWEGAGLPDGREGSFAGGCAYVSFQFYALDAGASGTSCVMCYDGVVWHEIFRAPAAGMRIRDVAIQPVSGNRAKLWIDMGGDLVYMTLPLNKARPIDDSGVLYQHEGVLYSSTIDCGAASKLPKIIKSLTTTNAHLNGKGIRIEADYQVDDNIGTNNWIKLTPFTLSPESTVRVGANNINQFRYRLRLLTDDNTTPADLKGIVPNGLARGETRMVWSMQVKGEQVSAEGKTFNPGNFLKYVKEAQENPQPIRMTSTNELFHDFDVEISLQRVQPTDGDKSVFILDMMAL